MRVIHFSERYSVSTETFIRQFFTKSCEFGESRFLCFEATSSDERVKILPQIAYKRKSILGFIRWMISLLSVRKKWEKSFLKEIDNEQAEVIHVHFGTSFVSLKHLILSGKISIPVVVSFYGYDISAKPLKDEKYAKEIGQLLSLPNVYAFGEGPELCKKIEFFVADRSRIIVNPLIVQLPKNGHQAQFGSLLKVLMIGRFIEKKGFHLALLALGELIEKIPFFEIILIGTGPMEEEYRSIARRYNMEDRLTFLGLRSHKEVLEALQNSDFFLHPSVTAANGDSEGGAPTIIIEAQAAGLPVIASDHADIPYVMGYHDFISHEGSLESLKSVILKAVFAKNLEHLIEKGILHVQKQHAFEDSTIYEDNLKKIINNFEANN
ncbi:glycosyltransferase [Ekhidna sp.]|uniref:glycosyltransferase n=1 Tax=Ekhidna sp. TaxID=2608089 RepID=UPI003CCBD419